MDEIGAVLGLGEVEYVYKYYTTSAIMPPNYQNLGLLKLVQI